MNSVGKKHLGQQGDFFTELSFSTLLGELEGKENLSWNLDARPAGEPMIRIKGDFDRVWNGREDQNFINRIFS